MIVIRLRFRRNMNAYNGVGVQGKKQMGTFENSQTESNIAWLKRPFLPQCVFAINQMNETKKINRNCTMHAQTFFLFPFSGMKIKLLY